jgi:murein endopeptidase
MRSASFALLFAALSVGCIGPFATGARGSSPATASASASAPGTTAAATATSNADDCDEATTPKAAGAPAADDDASDGEHSTIDDGFEPPEYSGANGSGRAAAFSELGDAELRAKLKEDIGALGSMSVGRTNGGALVAGVRMPDGDNWQVMHGGLAYGTEETVSALAHAIDAVAAAFPGTPKAFVGDISAKGGGHLHPHISHQSGRDVDLGYYLTSGHRWYADARGNNLDKPRTWHLIRTLIADSDVDLILVDRRIQQTLRAYALEIGEDPAWVDDVFQVSGKSKRPILFHVAGHATHLHVRFYNPRAQELGRRAYSLLMQRRIITPPVLYVTHTVKAGETLSHLAVRYKVTADDIKKANAMKKDILLVNKPYKIPQKGSSVVAAVGPMSIPARRVPPPLATAKANDGRGGGPMRRCANR